MKDLFVYARLLFISSLVNLAAVSGALATPVAITSLYDANSFLPGFLIPFKLTGDLITNGTIPSSSIATDNGVDCRMMADPFTPMIYLVKCKSAANVTLTFNILSSGTFTPVTYGPFAVRSLGSLSQIGGGGGGSAANIAQGKVLFNSTYNCLSCHSSSMPRKATASDIQSALNTVSDMAYLRGVVTSGDRDLLAAYLGSM